MQNKLSKTRKAFAYLITATIIWSVAVPVIKITLSSISLFSFLFFRFLIVCILVLPILVVELKRAPVDKKDYLNLFVLGLLGQASIILVFAGIKLTSATDTAIISILAPLIIIWEGSYFYHEKIKPQLKAGIFIASIGMLLVILEPVLSNQAATTDTWLRVIGNLILILYNVAFAVFIILSKRVMGKSSEELNETTKFFGLRPMKKKYSPILHTFISFFVALAVITPLFILESFGFQNSRTIYTNSWSIVPIAGIVYMAVLSSIVAYTLYQKGLKLSKVYDTAIIGYLGPVFTIPAAFMLLREVPTTTALVGAGVIAVGVVIAEKHKV